ncbi:MAG TPA: HEAT repeat domain-containing protein [Alphaproteobacteria bacterium]|nr:HEAT repeat domain-containing protein [Alphaproteobacteria bacterium]
MAVMIAEALGKFQHAQARAALISALNDPSVYVRTLAAEALEKLCHDEPVAQEPSHATPQGQR